MYRVCVLIPTYNRQVLAERALRSALAQGIADVEIVVVDDCSQPPFVLPSDLANLPNVRLIRHERNLGESGARNTGVAAARADWIAFLDSDNYWLPDSLSPRLAHAERMFAERGDPMIVHAAGFVVDNKRTGRRDARIPAESADPVDFASGCWFAQGSTSLLRKEVFDRVGPCDAQLRRSQDLDWFLRLALEGGQIRVWDKVVAVIETGPKASLAAFDETSAYLHAKFIDRNGAFALPPRLARPLQAYLDLEQASIFAAQGRWLNSALALARSFLRAPRLTVHLKRFWRSVALPEGL